MAIRLNDGGVNFLEQLSGGEPDSRQPFTWMYWAMDRAAAHDSFGSYTFIGNGAFSNYLTHRVDSDTTTIALATNAGQDNAAVSVDQNVWHHWALVREAEDGDVVLYRDAVEVARVTLDATALALADNIGVGLIPGTGLNTYIDVAYMRLWEVALIISEIEDELYSTTPVRSSNLYDYWLFASGALVDGENGHDWSTGGTPTFVADPTLPSPPSSISIPVIVHHLRQQGIT